MSKLIIFIVGLWLIFLAVGCSTSERPLTSPVIVISSSPTELWEPTTIAPTLSPSPSRETTNTLVTTPEPSLEPEEVNEEQIVASSTPSTINSMEIGHYTTIIELGGIGDVAELSYLAHVSWDSEEQSFVYALNEGVNLTEAKDLAWWKYDLSSQESREVIPPESLVNEETRKELELCPLNELDWDGPAKCHYLTALFESQQYGWIVYSPLLLDDFPYGEGELWVAQSDGSGAQKLADFTPAYVHWSSDGKWFITGMPFAGLPGQAIHYLGATDGSFFESLQSITGVDNFYLNGLFPEFSPDGQMLLYAGSKRIESRNADEYELYSLNLNTLESRLVTEKFGLFQWAGNGEGIYVLDGAFTPFDALDIGLMRPTDLFYVNLTQDDPQESLIASEIPYYAFSDLGSWNWTYSPTEHAIAYVGFQENNELGILQLEPVTEK